MVQQKSLVLGLVAGAGMLLLGSGCATLSKSDCLSGDWVRIGRQDGTEGHTRARFAKHVEACQKHGVSPNRTTYETGYKEGLIIYCTPENGFEVGRHGGGYENVCPASKEGAFMAQYRVGKEMYDLDARMSSIDHDIKSLEHKLETEVVYESDRRRVLDQVYRLRAEREVLQRKLIVLEVRNEERTARRR